MVLELWQETAGRAGGAIPAEFNAPVGTNWQDRIRPTADIRVLPNRSKLDDDIQPRIRVGIAMGEVVIADNTVTGVGVVLTQRVEQLADSGGLCITSAIHEALPKRMPFDLENLGKQTLKGFDDPVRVYRVELSPDQSIPLPQ